MSGTPESPKADLTQRALAAVQDLRARLAAAERARLEPVAVVGIGCRFPGGARDPASFWRLLRDGVDAVRELPADRWDVASWYDPTPDVPGKTYTRHGGFLDEVDRFDAAFFRIAPREAVHLDPQQRLLLEVAWEALEDAGHPAGALDGTRSGVFVGITTSDYAQLIRHAGPHGLDAYFPTGNALNAAAGRLSYVLGLHGPSMAVDAACASSLVAVHLAVQSLRNGECRLALAGGVNLILAPDAHVAMSRARALSPDGRCKTFDASADGYGRGEGCGVVVLKRLSDALSDGDRVLAVIRGTAVLHDGRSGGLTVPNGAAQQAVIRAALEDARIAPHEVGYVEAHGTGTSLGDPIEVRALGAVLGEDRTAARPLVLGSVKTNIGHLEAAAGVAGLIKVVLSLKHAEIPPHLHLRALNPDVVQEPTPKLVPTTALPWRRDGGRRIAGVSAFGLTGTVAHVVVEEPPAAAESVPPDDVSVAHVLPISAHTPEALRDLAHAWQEHLSRADAPTVRDLCYSASVRRSHHDHRLAAVGATHAELAENLSAFLAGEARAGLASGVASRARKLVFVFPGQGGQWPGMARDLLARERVFAEAIDECEGTLRPHVDWSLREILAADPVDARLDRIDVLQPALFSIQVALAALWRSWGIEPDAVVGHSMGELAAAHVAGALSLADAARVMASRSNLLRRIAGQGAMGLVELSLDDARRAIAGHEDRVSIAASNGPTSTVLSGDRAAVALILEALTAREVFCRAIKVDVASHSPQVEPLRAELLRDLAGLAPQRASVPFHSTVTGSPADGPELDAAYWVENLRKPVLFAPVIDRLASAGHDLFVELAPHPTLALSVQEMLRAQRRPGAVLPSMRRDESARSVLIASLGALYTAGHPVDWTRQHPAGGRVVSLPSYPWQRERFWVAPAADAPARRRRSGAGALLGEPLRSPALDDAVFESELSVAALSFLADHRIGGEVVVPGASHVVRTLAAAHQLFGPVPCTLAEVTFPSALVLPASEARTAQLIVKRDGAFRVVTARAGAESEDAAWTVHAVGRLEKGARAMDDRATVEDIRRRCAAETTGDVFYAEMSRAGYHLGPTFRWIDSIRHREGEALGVMRAPRTPDEANGYPLYPGLLDACFQLVAAASGANGPSAMAESGVIHVPAGLTHFRHLRAGAPRLCHVVLAPPRRGKSGDSLAEIRLLDEDGAVLAEAGFLAKRVAREVFVHGPRPRLEPFYRVEWQPAGKLERAKGDPAAPGRWILAPDGRGAAAELARILEARGCEVRVLDPADARDAMRLRRVLTPALRAGARGLVHLGALDGPCWAETTESTLDAARVNGCEAVLNLVQAVAQAAPRDPPRLWVVTAGTQPAAGGATASPAQASLWGLARVVAQEHPELRCTCIDVGADRSAAELTGVAEELLAGSREDQIALRGDARHVARLVRHAPGTQPETAAPAAALRPAAGRPVRLEIDTPGVLENLVLRAVPRSAPGPEEVEIEVRAAGINFVDVLSALGIRPDHTEGPTQLGGECAGVVTAVGARVSDLCPGDEVIAAIAPHCFRSFVVVPSRFVVRKPAHIGFEDAATLPITFMTAHWAMHHKGRLSTGERILIHAAAGGVGLAAVQLARVAGAEIFATAGSAEKRAYLRGLGIHHVMDSRSLSFADEVLERTDGKGVDAVLNCLTGDALAKSVSVLGAHGRFLEIGKRDIYDNSKLGLYPFHKNLSYFAVDLIRMYGDRPKRFAELLREIVGMVEGRKLSPLPWRAFPMSRAPEAFRHLAQAQHIGKVVLTLPDPEARLAPAAPTARMRADASYVITGGLGGLGLKVARWMVANGARHLVLAGRSAPSAAAEQAISALEREGARVLVARADVTRREDLERLLARADGELAPVRGVVHAAGVLDDGVLLQQTPERFAAVMAPKVLGSWNLHAATRDRPLDFFVLFSGAGTLLGSPGQGNYAAANAFLDALAHARRAEGLPAHSVAWGPWAEVGLAASAERGGRLGLRGVASLSPEEGIAALERVMSDAIPHVAVVPLDLRLCFQSYPALADAPLFATLAREESSGAPAAPREAPLRRVLLEARAADRRAVLERHLREQAARVLGLAPARIDVQKPLGTLGFDSLMTLELRNRLEGSLGLKLAATVIWSYPTITALSEHLLRRLEPDLEGAADATTHPGGDPAAPEPIPDAAVSAVESLSDDEAAAVLAEKLAALEQRSR